MSDPNPWSIPRSPGPKFHPFEKHGASWNREVGLKSDKTSGTSPINLVSFLANLSL